MYAHWLCHYVCDVAVIVLFVMVCGWLCVAATMLCVHVMLLHQVLSLLLLWLFYIYHAVCSCNFICVCTCTCSGRKFKVLGFGMVGVVSCNCTRLWGLGVRAWPGA